MRPTHLWFALTGVLTAVAPVPVGAQCSDWRAGPFVEPLPLSSTGATGGWGVLAAATWDPDGSGPGRPRLFIGGNFTTVNGLSANNIAAWSGASWETLGEGTGGSGDPAVLALETHGGNLFAGGNFGSAGGQQALRIARWDGSAWHPVGGGVIGPAASVRAMTVFNGDLIVGGGFTTAGGAGGVPASLIARWDGAAWHAMGAGLTGTPIYPFVNALIVHNGQLIAGGKFDSTGALPCYNVARWTGSSWVPLASGPGGEVQDLAEFNGQLIATGAVGIEAWNGVAWVPLGTGVFYGSALRVYDDQLFVGGQFTSVGGVPASNIARWNGSAWSAVGGGVAGPNSFVFTLHEYDNYLILGGRFETAAGQPISNLARTNSETNPPYGMLPLDIPFPEVHAFATLSARAIAAGSFVQPTASGESARRIAVWDGVELSNLGWGMSGPVRALESFAQPSPPFGTELVAGGFFTNAGGVTVNHVARWIESAIAFPPPAWEPMGVGFNDAVIALERFNNSTYAAGQFTASGATTVNHIARWDEPSDTWQPVGSGVNGPVRALRTGAVTPNGIELLVGGTFTTAGGLPAGHIARWSVNPIVPGSGSWSAMGPGFNSVVNAIERHNGSTYAAGFFTMSGSTPLNRIARWTGSAWVDVGGGFSGGTVRALESHNGMLYAAGEFTTAGGVTAERVARWNGSTWTQVMGGAQGPVWALHSFMGEVHAGGEFGTVRNGLVESPGWARYLADGAVWIAVHPQSATRPCGTNFNPDVQAAAGYVGLSYQWRKNGVPLVNGPTGTGSTVVGATGNLVVQDVGIADEGAYDCVVTNCGGSAVSNAATLTVTGCCYPDCNGSGSLTVADFTCFQAKFVAGDPYADCNQSGTLTVADFTCFQAKFVAGCP